MLQHALAKLFFCTVLQNIHQIDMRYLSNDRHFLHTYDITENGKQHVLKSLKCVIACHLIDLTVKRDFILYPEGLVIFLDVLAERNSF